MRSGVPFFIIEKEGSEESQLTFSGAQPPQAIASALLQVMKS
jgi:predicted DsbA family dithiol-disulfide isomerase